jgi:hypothetical protein
MGTMLELYNLSLVILLSTFEVQMFHKLLKALDANATRCVISLVVSPFNVILLM